MPVVICSQTGRTESRSKALLGLCRGAAYLCFIYKTKVIKIKHVKNKKKRNDTESFCVWPSVYPIGKTASTGSAPLRWYV